MIACRLCFHVKTSNSVAGCACGAFHGAAVLKSAEASNAWLSQETIILQNRKFLEARSHNSVYKALDEGGIAMITRETTVIGWSSRRPVTSGLMAAETVRIRGCCDL